VHAGRDAAAVVPDRHRLVGVDGHIDLGRELRQMFIDGVVHDLPDEMMQAGTGRAADVHARAFPDGRQAFQHLDVVCIVTALPHGCLICE